MNEAAESSLMADCQRVYQGINDPGVFRKLAGSSVLITGGTGFLGSWICHFLACVQANLGISFRVYIVGQDRRRFDERLGGLSHMGIEFLRCDVRRIIEIPKDVNYIIHAAGTPDSRFHISNPLETMSGIAEGTNSILRASERVSDLRMVIHLSSGSVYGSQPLQVQAIAEDHPPFSPPLDSIKSAYAEAKRYSEVLCAAARSEARTPLIVLRPFTFLGPFQSLEAPWAINNFIQDGLMGRPIRILGDGKTVRGFLYGADAAGWIVKILLAGRSGEVYNVGSPAGYTLAEIASKVAANFLPRPETLLNAALVPSNSPSRYLADTQKLFREFGLKQYTDMDLSIRRTVDWYQNSAVASKVD